MQKVVSAMCLRRKLGELLDNSYYRGDEFIIERTGKPVAAIVPLEEFKRMVNLRKEAFKIISEIRGKNIGVDPKQVAKDVKAVVQKVRVLKG